MLSLRAFMLTIVNIAYNDWSFNFEKNTLFCIPDASIKEQMFRGAIVIYLLASVRTLFHLNQSWNLILSS